MLMPSKLVMRVRFPSPAPRETGYGHASGGGARDHGMDRCPAACGGSWCGGLSLPLTDDPGTAVADRDQGAQVVPPVGGSTWAPWPRPATPPGGSTVNGRDRRADAVA
jgi:hypothetical protein